MRRQNCYATKLNRDERTENETMSHVWVPNVYWSLLSTLEVRSGPGMLVRRPETERGVRSMIWKVAWWYSECATITACSPITCVTGCATKSQLSCIPCVLFSSHQQHWLSVIRCSQLNLHIFACFCKIDHTPSYKGRLFSQWLSQVVMTGAQTSYPLMGEPAL